LSWAVAIVTVALKTSVPPENWAVTGVDLVVAALVLRLAVWRMVVKETVDMVALLRRLPLEGQTTRT
jgi:hypothetical protein